MHVLPFGAYSPLSQSPEELSSIDPSAEKGEHIDLLKPIARRFHNKVNFVWIDAVQFGDHAKALNLQEPKWPAFVI